MNERIKELAEQAEKWANKARWSTDPKFGDMRYSDLYNEKFAELIVKECTSLLREIDWAYDLPDLGPDGYEDPNAVAVEAADYLEEHFGVE